MPHQSETGLFLSRAAQTALCLQRVLHCPLALFVRPCHHCTVSLSVYYTACATSFVVNCQICQICLCATSTKQTLVHFFFFYLEPMKGLRAAQWKRTCTNTPKHTHTYLHTCAHNSCTCTHACTLLQQQALVGTSSV